MQDSGIGPDVTTCSSAISACGKGDQWEKALDLFREMRDHGIDPDIVSYSSVISACTKGHQWERTTLGLFRDMQGHEIKLDLIIYNTTISVCVKGGDWEKAEAKPPYLSVNQVTKAVMAVSNKRFGLRCYIKRPDIESYHPGVDT